MTLEEIIAIADEAYDVDGLVASCHNDPGGAFGDSLAKFVAVELHDTYEDSEDETQRREAARVMRVAIRQLACVANALDPTWNDDDLHSVSLALFPDAEWSEDMDGQFVIHTGQFWNEENKRQAPGDHYPATPQ